LSWTRNSQPCHPGEIVSGPDHEGSHLRPRPAFETCPPKSTHGLEPAEDLLDALPQPLADGISRVTRGARVDGRAGRALVILGDMRRDVPCATRIHERGVIISFVRRDRDALLAGHVVRTHSL